MPKKVRNVRRSVKLDGVTGKRKIGSGGRKGSAQLRAFASLSKAGKRSIRNAPTVGGGGGGKRLTRAQKVKIGSSLRKRRRASGRNPNTGR